MRGARMPYEREVGEEKAEENRGLNEEYINTGAEEDDSPSISFKKKKKKNTKKVIPQSIGECDIGRGQWRARVLWHGEM